MYPKPDPNQQKQQPTRAKSNCWKHLNRKTKQINFPTDTSKTPKLQNMITKSVKMSDLSVSCYKIISVNYFHESRASIKIKIFFLFPQN